MKKLISIDIGSTYTKGVLFYYIENIILPVKRFETPTTVDHLANGFFKVLENLISKEEVEKLFEKAKINKENYQKDKLEKNNSSCEEIEIFYSSSAKGGLKINAIGIVPDLTLKTAKLAALSAGGKVTKAFSYRLTKKNIKEIEEENPDIILFTGGTEGGNEDINIHNAEMLSNLSIKPVILYAGNSCCSDEIKEILENKGFEVKITENVLPNIDHINIDPAKNSIREIFLKNIVHGKGLDEIVNKIGFMPEPTPLSVFNFISVIPENIKKIRENLKDKLKDNVISVEILKEQRLEPELEKILKNEFFENVQNKFCQDKNSQNKNFQNRNYSIDINDLVNILNFDWDSFVAIDMGGATTDFYSYHKDIIEDSNVMIKGLLEPVVKRTVEGDLGMRVSAKNVYDSGLDFIKYFLNSNESWKKYAESEDKFLEKFYSYVCKVNSTTSYLPQNEEDEFFDELIATICIKLAGLRHAGKYKRIFTINGEKFIQYGKNLRHVKIMIGSGGYLSKMKNFNPEKYLTFSYREFFSKKDFYEADEEIPLLPEELIYIRDEEYLLPILANIAKKYPYEGTLCLITNLRKY